MNITIEVGGPLAEAINNLAAALVSAKQTDAIIEKASKRAPAKKAEPEVTAPAPVAEVKAEQVAEATGPTRDEAKKAVLTVAKEKGHDIASGLLKQFGATKISEVKEEDIAAIIQAAKEL